MEHTIRTLITVPKGKSTKVLLDASCTSGVSITGYRENAPYGEVHISLEGKPSDLRKIRENTREGKVRGCLEGWDAVNFMVAPSSALKQRR
jgi:hypothetical protein